MTQLFIAAKRVEHDGSRRVVVAGAVIGAVIGVQGPFAAADAICTGLAEGRRQPRGLFLRLRRDRMAQEAAEAEGIEEVRRAGLEAWDKHHEGAP